MTNPPSIRYNIKQSIFVHYEMRGRIFKKEEIYRKFEENSAAGRREGTFDITQCVYNGKAGGGKREKKSKCNRGYRWKENGIYS